MTVNNSGSADVTGVREIVEVPTLDTAGFVLLLLLIAGFGVTLVRRWGI